MPLGTKRDCQIRADVVVIEINIQTGVPGESAALITGNRVNAGNNVSSLSVAPEGRKGPQERRRVLFGLSQGDDAVCR
jgi:hypothetical protein